MREILLLCGHGLMSTAFMLSAAHYAGSRPGDAVALSYMAIQIVAAAAIVIVARREYRVPVAISAVPLAAWGTLCAALGAMSLSGNWL